MQRNRAIFHIRIFSSHCSEVFALEVFASEVFALEVFASEVFALEVFASEVFALKVFASEVLFRGIRFRIRGIRLKGTIQKYSLECRRCDFFQSPVNASKTVTNSD